MQEEKIHVLGQAKPKRPPRRSDPPPAMGFSPNKAAVDKGGWEYPLSREEKKHRLMYVYQEELAEAERANSENVAALKALKRRHSATKEQLQAANEAAPAASSLAMSGSLMAAGIFALVAMFALGYCSSSLIGRRYAEPSERAVEAASSCGGLFGAASTDNSSSVFLEGSSDTANATTPPNVSDRVWGLRSEGHVRLRLSNCVEAAWWFSSSLKMLALDINISEHRRSADHNDIRGELGFALVCSQRFKEGVVELEQHFNGVGPERVSPHLFNAFGYAYFNLQDFTKATDAFYVGMQRDSQNPVLWSNLGAARMMLGDFESADNAFMSAAEAVEKMEEHQDHHATLVAQNVQLLQLWANHGPTEHRPTIDLWNGYLYDSD